MLYREWIEDDVIDKAWMTSNDFFVGLPLEQEDAPISAVMREAVYRYISDVFGGARLSLTKHERWAELFRARLTEINGSFWKQMQMDLLVRIKDMVTADYTEYIQNYNRGVSEGTNSGTSENNSEFENENLTQSETSPITTTITDTESTKTTTTTTPTTASRRIELNSVLAEASYIDPVVQGGVGVDGMPTMDTTHGDTAAGNWSIAGGQKVEEEVSTPTGNIEQTQGQTSSENLVEGSGTNNSNSKNDSTQKSLSASIGGVLREGHRDFDGYALKASIESVQMLLPYNYLQSALSSLFRIGEEDGLWL